MKLISEVSPEKLRGGFYTPDSLVDQCVRIVSSLTSGRTALRVVEPSIGDGAFLRGFDRSGFSLRIEELIGIELLDSEARKSRSELRRLDINGRILNRSAVSWAASADDIFDVAVGNPPFVRYQFVSPEDRASTTDLARRIGVSFAGVSNLWIPVILGTLSKLRDGGVFAFVVPAECFTGISAGEVREWLVHNSRQLRVDLFPAGSFPEVLQEVVILSGIRSTRLVESVKCKILEHGKAGRARSSTHLISNGREPWTRYLLTRDEIHAFEEIAQTKYVSCLGKLAKFEVAAVTGANGFFSLNSAELEAHELEPWSRPLLARIRHAPGLKYTDADHEIADGLGLPVHLLDFSESNPDPKLSERAKRYLATGVKLGLNDRYKCRIRSPWYRVPFIRPGEMMLSKRSHYFPRMVLNEKGAVTTDTIYRGVLNNESQLTGRDLVAGFHNSLTLLSAELEGRSFGGGVLELVPSEVSRLVVPAISGFGIELERLDAVARADDSKDALIEETDLFLVKADVGITQDLMDLLQSARYSLLDRRLQRSETPADL